MTADNVLVGLFAAFLAVLLVVGLYLKSILAFTTRSKDDLSQIRANLEGVLGEAGPGMKVIDIAPRGATLPTRNRAAERSYLVTLQRPDGGTEQRSVSVEVSLLGQGELTLDRRHRSRAAVMQTSPAITGPSSPWRREWWLRLPLAVRLVAVILVAGLVLGSFSFASGLPNVLQADDQLTYVLGRRDVHLVQVYGRARLCGLFTVGRSTSPGWFYYDGHDVWTGKLQPGGPGTAANDRSDNPYDRWSDCVANGRWGKGDSSFTLWVLRLFR